MRVRLRRYTHSSPPSVYNHMLIPINLLLVGAGGEGRRGEENGGEGGGGPPRGFCVRVCPRPPRGGLKHSHMQL